MINEENGQHPSRPWDWIAEVPKAALESIGIEINSENEDDYWCHVIAEDPRYPTFCVNGEESFGMDIDPETGLPFGDRFCICMPRDDFSCFCSI